MTPEQAVAILTAGSHDLDEIETYVYGPDDPAEYFAKITGAEELNSDFTQFLKG